MKNVLVVICLVILSGCEDTISFTDSVRHGLAGPTLSPDNQSIIFTLCDVPGRCDLATIEIATGNLTRSSPTGQDCLAPVYSPDGQMLTFTSGTGDDRNIFVMNSDGSNLRQLTFTVNDKTLKENGNSVVRLNALPSFSWDSGKIIFTRSGVRRRRSMGGKMLSHWDVYEVDVATARERRLTYQKYYNISSPFYLPYEQGYLFSSDGPKRTIQPAAIDKKFGTEIIRVAGADYPRQIISPTVSAKGTIVFVSRSNDLGGTKGPYSYDLFVYRDKKTIRLTEERFAILREPFLSFDGSLVVFLASGARTDGAAMWLINIDGTGLTKIGTPWRK